MFACCRALLISGCTRLPMHITLHEGRLAAAMPGSGQQEHGPIEGKEGHTEVYEQISGDTTEQYGTGTQQPSGSFPVPRRRQDIHISPHGNATEYPEEPPFDKMKKDCQAEGVEIPKTIMVKDPVAHMITPQGWTNAKNGQSSDDER